MTEQAKCPECDEWGDMHIVNAAGEYVPPADRTIVHCGVWWKDSLGCPKCGAVVCVEMECEFRKKVSDETLRIRT